MEKISAQNTLSQVEANDKSPELETEPRDQIRVLSDFEMLFVGGGDDMPGWHP